MVSASLDKTLKLWEVESGKEILAFTGHKSYVISCIFSPSGIHLISASEDKSIKLWNVSNGQCLKTFLLPWIPNTVTFSPKNPNLVVTANANGTLTLFKFDELE